MLYSLRYPTLLLLLLLPLGLAALAYSLPSVFVGTLLHYVGIYCGSILLVNVVVVPLLYLVRHVYVVRPQLALARASYAYPTRHH